MHDYSQPALSSTMSSTTVTPVTVPTATLVIKIQNEPSPSEATIHGFHEAASTFGLTIGLTLGCIVILLLISLGVYLLARCLRRRKFSKTNPRSMRGKRLRPRSQTHRRLLSDSSSISSPILPSARPYSTRISPLMLTPHDLEKTADPVRSVSPGRLRSASESRFPVRPICPLRPRPPPKDSPKDKTVEVTVGLGLSDVNAGLQQPDPLFCYSPSIYSGRATTRVSFDTIFEEYGAFSRHGQEKMDSSLFGTRTGEIRIGTVDSSSRAISVQSMTALLKDVEYESRLMSKSQAWV